MKKIFTRLGMILCIFLFTGCYTLQVDKVESNQDLQSKKSVKKNGVLYSLPRKEFQLQVSVEETNYEASPLATLDSIEYHEAIKCLGWKLNIIRKQDPTYKIIAINILERSVPDTANVYFVSLLGDKAPFLKSKHSFSFESGIFLAESAHSSEDQTFEFVAEAIPEVIKLALGGGFNLESLSSTIDSKSKGSFDFTTDAKKGSNCKELTKQIIDRINELHLKRDAILSAKIDVAVYENNQTALLLQQIEIEEQQLIAFLQGKKTVKTVQHFIAFDPQSTSNILFYFSSKDGISLTDASRDPITFTIADNPMNKKIDNFYSNKENTIKRKGIYYRIPYFTEVVVKQGVKEWVRTYLSIPQMGSVGFLPSKIAIRSNELTYSLDAKNGALLKFSANGEGINPEDAQKILEAAGNTTETEITRLENLIKLKELQNKLDSLNDIR